MVHSNQRSADQGQSTQESDESSAQSAEADASSGGTQFARPTEGEPLPQDDCDEDGGIEVDITFDADEPEEKAGENEQRFRELLLRQAIRVVKETQGAELANIEEVCGVTLVSQCYDHFVSTLSEQYGPVVTDNALQKVRSATDAGLFDGLREEVYARSAADLVEAIMSRYSPYVGECAMFANASGSGPLQLVDETALPELTAGVINLCKTKTAFVLYDGIYRTILSRMCEEAGGIPDVVFLYLQEQGTSANVDTLGVISEG